MKVLIFSQIEASFACRSSLMGLTFLSSCLNLTKLLALQVLKGLRPFDSRAPFVWPIQHFLVRVIFILEGFHLEVVVMLH